VGWVIILEFVELDGDEPFKKLPVLQMLKDVPELYGTRMFITVFTTA
jgi:hypothetical protein